MPTLSMEDSWLMRVECLNDAGTRQAVLFLMKQARARDIRTDNSTGTAVIEAAYYKMDNLPAVLQRIQDDLRRMPEVLDVFIQDNPTVIRQAP